MRLKIRLNAFLFFLYNNQTSPLVNSQFVKTFSWLPGVALAKSLKNPYKKWKGC